LKFVLFCSGFISDLKVSKAQPSIIEFTCINVS
jgi:hypothetical protein